MDGVFRTSFFFTFSPKVWLLCDFWYGVNLLKELWVDERKLSILMRKIVKEELADENCSVKWLGNLDCWSSEFRKWGDSLFFRNIREEGSLSMPSKNCYLLLQPTLWREYQTNNWGDLIFPQKTSMKGDKDYEFFST